jgi:Cytochrome c554 and c-prime
MKPTPRSVGRFPSRAALLVGVAGLAAIFGLMASPGDACPKLEPPLTSGPLRIGMNSCAARGCHGAVEATDPGRGQVYIKDGAYTTWLQYDPHARAYAVLLEPRSVKIADKLKSTLGGPAHKAELCLSCHATVGPAEAKSPEIAPLSDGISCEACHGPAEVWQEKHLSPAWRVSAARSVAKSTGGMNNLSTPAARARTCVGCHVGDRSRGMDMNHDLIAAGHPRLNFEYSSYLANYPKHWKEKEPSAGFEANSWAIGQVVTAEAVLDLVAARALASEPGVKRKAPAPEAVWPEFSEYECFACHHELANPSPYQKPGSVLGQLPWQTWPSTMLPDLAKVTTDSKLDAWSGLKVEMAHAEPRPDEVAKLVVRGKAQLGELLKALETQGFGPPKNVALLKELASGPMAIGESWDRAAQRYLALQALTRDSKKAGRAIDPAVEKAIEEGARALDFPAHYDSPRNKH